MGRDIFHATNCNLKNIEKYKQNEKKGNMNKHNEQNKAQKTKAKIDQNRKSLKSAWKLKKNNLHFLKMSDTSDCEQDFAVLMPQKEENQKHFLDALDKMKYTDSWDWEIETDEESVSYSDISISCSIENEMYFK